MNTLTTWFVKQRVRPHFIKHKLYNIQLEPEKYFHSLLVLFKPWRQEADILNAHNILFDAFIDCRDTIESALEYNDRPSRSRSKNKKTMM